MSQTLRCGCGYLIHVTTIEEMDALAGATDAYVDAYVMCPQCGEDNEFTLPPATVCDEDGCHER